MPDFTGYSIHQPQSFGANSGWSIGNGISAIQNTEVDPRRTTANGGGTANTSTSIDDSLGDQTLVVSFGNPGGSDIIIPNESEASGDYTITSTPIGYKLYAFTNSDDIPSIRVRFNGGAWSSSIPRVNSVPNSTDWDQFSFGYTAGTVEVELLGDSNGDTILGALLLVKDYTISESEISNIPSGCVFFDPIADGETQQYGGSFQSINDGVRAPTNPSTDGSISCFTENNVGQFIVEYQLSGAFGRINLGLPVDVTHLNVHFKPGDIDPKAVNLRFGNSWFTEETTFSDSFGGGGWRVASFPTGQSLEFPIGQLAIEFKCNDTDGDDNEIYGAYLELCYSGGNTGSTIGPAILATLLNNQTIRPPWL